MTKLKQKDKKSTKKLKIIGIVLLVVAVIIFGIVSAFVLSSNKKHAVFEFEDDIVKGIDVSYHNGKIDWDTVSNEVDFAMIRAGYRGYSNAKLVEDKKFKEYIKGANKNELPVGVYFFSQAVTPDEAKEEAEFVLDLVEDYDISLPIVIDFEYGTDKKGNETGRLLDARLTTGQATEIINAFCTRIEKGGYTSGVYASKHFFNWVIDTKNIIDTAYIWLAEYHEEVSYKGDYNMWQYTNKGSCKGVGSKNVDFNYLYNK